MAFNIIQLMMVALFINATFDLVLSRLFNANKAIVVTSRLTNEFCWLVVIFFIIWLTECQKGNGSGCEWAAIIILAPLALLLGLAFLAVEIARSYGGNIDADSEYSLNKILRPMILYKNNRLTTAALLCLKKNLSIKKFKSDIKNCNKFILMFSVAGVMFVYVSYFFLYINHAKYIYFLGGFN